MKVERIKEIIAERMALHMRRIERSRNEGHLAYLPDILSDQVDRPKFPDMPKSANELGLGFTSCPAFEHLTELIESTWPNGRSELSECYRLRPGYTLSDGLECLLNSGTTIIDCVQATRLAAYFSLRDFLCEAYGDELGATKFNAFFKASPFILTNKNFYRKWHFSALRSTCFIPFDPLTYLFGLIPNVSEQSASDIGHRPYLPIGGFVHIDGVNDYNDRHPFGMDGSIDVVCVGADQYLGFGLGERPLSEQEILDYLEQAYQQQPISLKSAADQILAISNRALISQRKLAYEERSAGRGREEGQPGKAVGYRYETARQFVLARLEKLASEEGFAEIQNAIAKFAQFHEKFRKFVYDTRSVDCKKLIAQAHAIASKKIPVENKDFQQAEDIYESLKLQLKGLREFEQKHTLTSLCVQFNFISFILNLGHVRALVGNFSGALECFLYFMNLIEEINIPIINQANMLPYIVKALPGCIQQIKDKAASVLRDSQAVSRDAVKFLTEVTQLNADLRKSSVGEQLLQLPQLNELDEKIKFLQKIVNERQQAAAARAVEAKFRMAAATANLQELQALRKEISSINCVGDKGRSALSFAIDKACQSTKNRESYQQVVQYLLAEGADIHLLDKESKAPLQYATNDEVLSWLPQQAGPAVVEQRNKVSL